MKKALLMDKQDYLKEQIRIITEKSVQTLKSRHNAISLCVMWDAEFPEDPIKRATEIRNIIIGELK